MNEETVAENPEHPEGAKTPDATDPAKVEDLRKWFRATARNYPFSAQSIALDTFHSQLDDEIRKLRTFIERSKEGRSDDKVEADLRQKNAELEQKLQLDFLLSRVNDRAKEKLLSSGEFRSGFLERSECEAFVVSVDIRRSTELMLKAKTPEKFATFITELCAEFLEIITRNFGVFDKFTGDGVLAFFPSFFSGPNAGALAAKASVECHEAFETHYRANRSSFTSILTNVGLGIGIDFGVVHLVKMPGSLTVVGVPVVYACRLGGAPAKATYLNQPAFDEISASIGRAASFEEAVLNLKHEGEVLAYKICPTGLPFLASPPDWAST